MKTTTKILTTIAVAAIIGAGAFSYKACATGTEFSNQPGRAFFRKKLAELGVTDSQKTQIRTILREHLPTAQPLVQGLVTERRALRDTIRADQMDETAIRAQAAKVAVIEANLAVERARIVHDIKPVLTPDQISKLKDMQTNADDRFDYFLSQVAKNLSTN